MYIYSTLSNDQKINLFKEVQKGQVARTAGFVIIKGKANIANKNLVTAKGVVTKVTDEEYELLKNNKSYKNQVKAGFLCSDKARVEGDDKAKSDMTAKDGSAPLIPKDATDRGLKIKSGEDVAL